MAGPPGIRLLSHGSARRAPGYVVPWRRLPGLLLEWTDGGTWRVERDGRPPCLVPAGGVLALPPECRHRMTALGPACTSHWLVILITVDGLPMPGIADLPAALPGRRLVPLARRLAVQAGDLAAAVRQAGWLHELVALVLAAGPPLPLPAPRAERITRLLAEIAGRLDEPLTRADLARCAGLSPTRFHAVFAAATGMAPMAWLRHARLRRARELLAATDLRIGEIAGRCGFASPYHFSRLFHRQEGGTPSAWRAGLRRGPGGG